MNKPPEWELIKHNDSGNCLWCTSWDHHVAIRGSNRQTVKEVIDTVAEQARRDGYEVYVDPDSLAAETGGWGFMHDYQPPTAGPQLTYWRNGCVYGKKRGRRT